MMGLEVRLVLSTRVFRFLAEREREYMRSEDTQRSGSLLTSVSLALCDRNEHSGPGHDWHSLHHQGKTPTLDSDLIHIEYRSEGTGRAFVPLQSAM